MALGGLLGAYRPLRLGIDATNIIFGEITLINVGEYPNSLGTLSSRMTVDRGAWQDGPTPIATGDPGQFSLDLSSITGDYVDIRVNSNVANTSTFVYATWLTTPPTLTWAEPPTDLLDLKLARICSKTKWWVPGHALAYFRGRPYWNQVCPTGQPGPEDLLPPPGLLVTAPDGYPGSID